MYTKKQEISTKLNHKPPSAYYESGKNTPTDAGTGKIAANGMRQKKQAQNKGLPHFRNQSRCYITSMLKDVA